MARIMHSFIDKLRLRGGRDPAVPDSTAVGDSPPAVGPVIDSDDIATAKAINDPTTISPAAQAGIQKIEAVTLTWNTFSLVLMLINIWLIFLTNGFRISVLASLAPFVTSEWQFHSLTAVIYVVSSAMASATYIPVAKLLDTWGRAEAFLFMVALATLGVICQGASRNLPTFCAGEVLYDVGFSGIVYTICVLAADVTSLKNRALAFAFTSSPYMVTAFAGPKAAEGFLLNVTWRWGFGAFAIIVPCVTVPMFIHLKYHERKAVKSGLYEKPLKSTQPFMQRAKQALIEFDMPGVFLFAGGLVVFLLPFTIAAKAPNGWASDYIIAMLVVGFVTLVGFALYEIYLAPAPFINGKFLLDRTVISACMINFTYQISYYCWNSYFTSFLQVVCNISVSEAGYINNTFQVVSGVVCFAYGYAIRVTGRFKWLYYIAIPLFILGQALMIHFRQPNQYVGYIIMCEIFMSLGGSVFILLAQVACLAAVDHQNVASVLAFLFVVGGIGGSIGYTISGAIWTNTFLPALQRNLPESAVGNATLIFGSLPAQLAYPVGSPERVAIQEAYGYAQTRMLAVGTGVAAVMFFWLYFMKNINVNTKAVQTKGTVF
ncbi:Putative major facilitator superfamily, MFS transporter superfamily [Colletotrichum destructivum]|uniref:Major facilitator superfamily, MFS transporter superfamily n=1 Tax=Colletotrichum destructivum TaxID=34406 RepID=A0AAX4IKI3_9PEZI|nr:Putative major facilitator superfamily, MFS transporter superfamily [Colletotrichum destructivum]